MKKWKTVKIDKSLKESELLIKGISKTIKNKPKEQKGGFPPMILDTLVANLQGSTLIGEGVIRAGEKYYKSIIKMNLNLRVFIQVCLLNCLLFIY